MRREATTALGRQKFTQIGCAQCHIPDLQINRDRRVADVETVHDPVRGNFNTLFATASASLTETNDGKRRQRPPDFEAAEERAVPRQELLRRPQAP